MLLGDVVARWWALRQLSLSVARMIDAGEAPAVESALVKEMGTRFEQDVLERVLQLVDVEPSPASASLFERLLAAAVLTGAVVHDPRRHQRDPALGGGEGLAMESHDPTSC